MRIKLLAVLAAGIAVTAASASADPRYQPRSNQGRQDRPPHWLRTRTEVFNVFCKYENRDGYPRKCYAGALFRKKVTWDGSEIEDNSEYPNNPVFEIECDGDTVFNEHARRFTDREGTRLQALGGPYPAVLLPEGALREGRRRVRSLLELRDLTLDGSCHVYTGER